MGQTFEKIGKLPMWNETYLISRVKKLRALGAERVCFKTGPFDPKDLVTILKIACLAEVDLVTFDGAGGGTGNSPIKMMNEWGMPTVQLESCIREILLKLDQNGYELPQVAITGGFAMEDQVFKGLALGTPYIQLVGIGRAAMAAANTGKQIGALIEQGKVPKKLEQYGDSIETIFEDYKMLKLNYGEQSKNISAGAIGVYSYLERICVGLQQLMALNRRFSLAHISREDIVPLSELAEKITGLETYEALLHRELNQI
jgi:glutamate synthase domain-containing protein 2